MGPYFVSASTQFHPRPHLLRLEHLYSRNGYHALQLHWFFGRLEQDTAHCGLGLDAHRCLHRWMAFLNLLGLADSEEGPGG